ncbi:MAG: hypothetical protein KJZ74_14765 [Gemmatimonadales bacterium]|nr:hypothetical protein [Gemmatimonadales bacterium]
MRRIFRLMVAGAIAAVLVPSLLDAQVRVARSGSTVTSAVAVYNASATMRVSGALEVAADREVTGDVAVLNGPVVIAGRITGSLVAINADVRLATGARIGEQLLVIGGTVERADGVQVGGEVRVQAEVLRYSMQGERLVPEEAGRSDWRPHWDGPGMEDRPERYTDLFYVAAQTYNRVEGLPILAGPRFRLPTEWGRMQVEAFGIVRTAGPMRWDRGTLGHDVRAELRLGVKNGLTLSGRAFDRIDPVEAWQLQDKEAGLATFVLHRDHRDYYGRHGWEGALGGRLGEEASLQFVAGSETWRAVEARRPFTLFRDSERWRENPAMDVGQLDLASVRLRVDTRERARSPWLGGWYLSADFERGSGTLVRDPGPSPILNAPEAVTYTRGFLDARRYNKLSPGTEVNMRLLLGGWLGGDELPLQKRSSIGGPGAVDGYDFRRATRDPVDVFTCGGIDSWPGRAALCDRVAMAQLEVRQEFDLDWFRTDRGDTWWRPGFNTHGAWVLFADAGRGWRTATGGAGIEYANGIPPLSTFRTTIGAGVDFGSIGFYFAKALSTGDEPMNVIVRLGRRF